MKQEINISAFEKLLNNSNYNVVQTMPKCQYMSNKFVIGINYNHDIFLFDRNMIFGKESEFKPELYITVMISLFSAKKYGYDFAISAKKVTHYYKDTCGNISKSKAIKLESENNCVYIPENYYKLFSANCDFMVCSENVPEKYQVFVYGKGQLIGIICALFEDSNNWYED